MKKSLIVLIIVLAAISAHAQVPAYVPSSGLLAWYPFTGNANDLSGNSYNGTVTGATLTTDRFGNANSAYSFDGISNFIKVNYVTGFNQYPLTINVWVNSNTATRGGIVGRYQGCSNNGYQVYQNLPGRYSAYYFCANGSNVNLDVPSAIQLNDGLWKMLTTVFDNDSVFVYIDNVLTEKYQFQVLTPHPDAPSATTDLYIGDLLHGSCAGSDLFFTGKIDDIGIWGRALTPCEINQLYTSSTTSISAISGITSICQYGTAGLSDAATGGTWSSNNNAVATVGSSGTVNGVLAGSAIISYTTTGSCFVTTTVMVNPILTSPLITTIAGNGTGSYGGDNGAATAGMIASPSGIAVDNSGNVYIADIGNNRVRKVSTSGIITTIAGTGTVGFSGDGFPATAATLNNPYGVTTDASGNIYITDDFNSRIRKIDAGGIITTIAGTATAGYFGDGIPATTAQMNNPNQMVINNSNGDLYFADWANNRIRKVSAAGIITTVAGNGTGAFTADGIAATASGLHGPAGVALDAGGNIYISDGASHRIRKVNTSGIISTIGGTGVSGFSGDGLAATSAKINNPSSIAVDGAGNIYFTDQSNNRVRKITPAGIISSVAGTGTGGYNGDNIAAAGAQVNVPYDIAVDNTGNLYIADAANHRIRKIAVGSMAAITGPAMVCQGASIALTDVTPSGAWSNVNTAVATVGTATGIVAGVTAGTATISYTGTYSCGNVYATQTITVTPLPLAGTITGMASVCVSGTMSLTDASAGGVWSSGATTVATVNSSGIVTGIATGTATISYTVANGCGTATTTVTATVGALASAGTISGAASVCAAVTISLTDATAGGVWSSSATTIATVNSSGVVTGIAAGTATISYSVTAACGTASATKTITINPLPVAGTITGPTAVCALATTALTDAAAGGVWSSIATTIATISGSGVVAGVTTGTATISYTVTNGCGAIAATTIVTVNPLPVAGTITGTTAVCVLAATILTDATAGGVWSSDATTIATVSSGVVTGVTAGTATISYTAINGCGITAATTVMTVNPLPVAGSITGTASVCMLATTILTDATAGGVWSSGATGIATVSGTGFVNGISAGTSTISYTVTNGCGVAVATRGVTVNPLPAAGTITGASSVCMLATTSLTDAVAGGGWSSGSTGIATVSSSGIVTGVAAGTATISYTVINGCGTAVAAKTLDVNALPLAGIIAGAANVCESHSIALSNTGGSGVWSSGATGIATVSSSGTVTGMAAGTTTISYVVSNGCGSATATHGVSIDPLPLTGMISGHSSVCMLAATTLSCTVLGGVWSSGNTAIATVSSGGVITGMSPGAINIYYTVTNGCGSVVVNKPFVVDVLPIAGIITGTATVCELSVVTLTDMVAGGVWSSSATFVASVSAGVVAGVAAGSAVISYSVTNSCGTDIATKTIIVAPLPVAGTITGGTPVCVGASIALSDAVTGGTWSSSTTGIATITTSGIVNGISKGTATISYTVANGCGVASAIETVTVDPLPLAGIITGTTLVCVYASSALTDGVPGGTWTSSNTGIANVSTSGVVMGIVAGTTGITYTVANSCGVAATGVVVTVNRLPVVATITGDTSICGTGILHLSDVTTGGTWSSGNTSIGTVVSGEVAGVITGIINIFYTVSNSCGSAVAKRTVLFKPLPVPFIVAIDGELNVSHLFNAYQWQVDGHYIPGATNATYTPISNGKYTVLVKGSNYCSAVSPVYSDYSLAIDNSNAEVEDITIYPNPVSATLNVRSDRKFTASILTIKGELIINGIDARKIDVSKLVPGTYLIRIYNDQNLLLKASLFTKN